MVEPKEMRVLLGQEVHLDRLGPKDHEGKGNLQ